MENYIVTVIGAVLLPFVLCVILCHFGIPFLKKLHFGQYIREEGPKSHQSKTGTPTMGGVLFIIAVLISAAVYIILAAAGVIDDSEILSEIAPVILTALGFGIIGFIDDYIKVVKKRNLGLTEIQKFSLQFVVTILFCIYSVARIGTDIVIPFTGGLSLNLPVILYVILLFVAVLGTVNGANFTDGLDGLNTKVTMVIAVFFVFAAAKSGMSLIPAMIFGALLGFILYNTYPARVFMGDTGSLFLGGFVAAEAIVLKMPIFIVIVAFIYLIEVLSVILQVGYFKYTKKKYGEGRRIFKMAPLHHHFQESGYAETQVVTAFTVVTILLCLIACIGL